MAPLDLVRGGGGAPPRPAPGQICCRRCCWRRSATTAHARPDPEWAPLLEGRALTTARARPDLKEGRALEEGQTAVAGGGPHGRGHRLAAHTPTTLLEEASHGHTGLGAAQPRRACTSCYGLANACLREGGRGGEEEAHGEWREGDDRGRFIMGWVRTKSS